MAKAPNTVTVVTDGHRGTIFTIDELRVVLSDTIRDLRMSDTSAASANAISNATGKILGSVKLQMEFYRMTGKPMPDIPFLLAA